MTALVRVGPENETERVEQVSSHNLDQAMRAVFSSKTFGGTVTYYAATLVLKLVLNLAYPNPKIKTQGNGTIEPPMSFQVDANTPQRL